jgi:hypothetical protein
MKSKKVTRVALIGMLLGAFALGYVCGWAGTPHANAQIPQIPGGITGQAGGALGTVTQLGSSITEMEQHLSGLQKNLDTFKKIQSALTGSSK